MSTIRYDESVSDLGPRIQYCVYELQFDLERDVGLDYAPRQLFSSSSY
jgi:hypothetical protein